MLAMLLLYSHIIDAYSFIVMATISVVSFVVLTLLMRERLNLALISSLSASTYSFRLEWVVERGGSRVN